MSTTKREDGSKRPDVSSTPLAMSISGSPNPWAVAEFVARFDEVAKKRLDNMNQKLKDLERQMEVLEAEMNRANDCEKMLVDTPPQSFGS